MEVWRFAPWKFEPFGRSLETFQEFPIRRRRFPIWCAVAKPHGMDADAWCLHQCGGINAYGSRSEAAHQFPNFGAVAPSVPLCLCVSQPRRASALRTPSRHPLCASVPLCESTSSCVSLPCSIAPSPSVPLCESTSSRVSSPCSIAIPLCASVSLCEPSGELQVR